MPALQLVQLDEPALEYVPPEQFVHVETLVAPVAEDDVPAGQLVQLAAPAPA